MSRAYVIAITPAERDFLKWLLQWPLDEGPDIHKSHAKALMEMLEPGLTDTEAFRALGDMTPEETEARANGS